MAIVKDEIHIQMELDERTLEQAAIYKLQIPRNMHT